MATVKEIGEVKEIPSVQKIEWSIPDFFKVAEDTKILSLVSSRFSVTGVLWHLRVWPNYGHLFLACDEYEENTGAFLAPDAHRQYSLEYDFGLKKSNGTIEHLFNGIVKKSEARNDDQHTLIEKTQLLQRKSELVPGNVLTIVCIITMTEFSQSSTQPETILNNAKPLKLIRLDKLSENFKDLFTDKETCDTTLKVQDKEYKAHRSVLIARSSVFAATFKHDTLEKQTGVITIPDCDPDSFAVFLDYLYSGKLEELTICNALNLHYASDKYDIPELKTFCVEYLMQHLTVENICEVGVFADKYEETELFCAVQDFFTKNMDKIFVTSEWQSFMIKENRLATKFLIEMSKVKVNG